VSGDAEDAGHFWGTTTTLADGSTGLGDGWWTHTQRPVPVYYQGEGSEVVDLFTSTGIEAYGTVINGVPGLIDQAHIAEAMDAVLLGGDTADTRLMAAQASVISPTVALTSDADLVFVADAANQVTLRGNTLHTGAGNDQVDVAAIGGFNNTLFTGSGVDTIYAGALDVITGGSGDDALWATAGPLIKPLVGDKWPAIEAAANALSKTFANGTPSVGDAGTAIQGLMGPLTALMAK
jgi:alkaline phosphatase